ncbi:MAG: hypothetical protein CMN30_08860 [Sandaracinus sp.]|nr:hypothetical protein [Sandaracinus sp.]
MQPRATTLDTNAPEPQKSGVPMPSNPTSGPTPEEILARVGSTVGGKYRIRTLVGAGGMGAVFEAVNVMTEAPVAVKLLLTQHAQGGEAEKRFLQEAKVAANLHHPNIVQVFDLGQDEDGSWFIVQELLGGSDLENRLDAAGGTLDLRETCELLVPVMTALGKAHEAGVVHRDLKPSNIFVDRRLEDPVPKLIDFGVSKVVEGPASGRAITQQGGTVGTPDFMAPEQALGAETLGPTVDVWAVGCLFFRCLAGRGPFPGPGLAVLAQMQQSEPDRLDAVADVPEDIAAVIAGALRRDPAERYATMAHFLGALFRSPTVLAAPWGRKLARRYYDEAHDPPPKSDLRIGLRAKRAQIGLGVAAVLLSAAAVGIALWRSEPAEDDTRSAPETEEPVPTEGSVAAAACAPWRDALMDLREDDDDFRGVPQLPTSGMATGQAIAGLGAAKRLCGGVSGADLEAIGAALARFERGRGYGRRGGGHDDLATAWALFGLRELGDERRINRARRDLERGEGRDGSYGDGSPYVSAIALLALGVTEPPDGDADRSATATFLADALLASDPTEDTDGGVEADAAGQAALIHVALRVSGALEGLEPERRAAVDAAVTEALLADCSPTDGACDRDPAETGRSRVPASGDNAGGIAIVSWVPWTLAALDGLPASAQARLEPVTLAAERAQIDDVERVVHSGTSVLAEHLVALGLR